MNQLSGDKEIFKNDKLHSDKKKRGSYQKQ